MIAIGKMWFKVLAPLVSGFIGDRFDISKFVAWLFVVLIANFAFTPDIFMPLFGGVLIDNFPGPAGYRYFFLATAAICAVGLMASLVIYFKIVKNQSGESNA